MKTTASASACSHVQLAEAKFATKNSLFVKKVFLKSMLLLCALIVGSSSVWGQAAVNTVLWSEDFSGYDANGVPSGSITNSHTGTTVYGGVTITYASEDGDTDTKVYTSGGPGTDNNLLISKNDGSFSVLGISTGGATELTLSYAKGGQGTLSISTSTEGVSISGTTITIDEASTFDLTFKNTHATKNLRIDDISVKVKTAGTSGSGVAAPTFTVVEGAVTVGTSVGLEQDGGKTIRYTLDGTDPTKTTGTVYSSAIVINTPTTIKAIAVDGDNVSPVSAATYTIDVPEPTLGLSAGAVYKGTLLTIDATDGYTIIYTTNGTNPSYANSIGEIYDSPIAINTAMTVKAIAVDAYDNESDIVSAAYTVNYYGAVDITPNYTFFGKKEGYSGTTYDEVSGTKEGITVTHTRGTGSIYANASAMRFYANNSLKIDAPTGKTITLIIFTQSNAETDNISSSPSGYTTSTHTWEGNASSVTFSRSSGSYMQFTNIKVVLANKVTIVSACTDGEGKYYGTYSSGKAFKVPSSLVVSEIKLVDGKLSLSNYSTGDVVPANTGVLIASDTYGNHTMEIATGGTSKLGANNLLKPSGDDGIEAKDMNAASTTFYRLTMHNGTDIGFWWGAADGAAFDLAANKAYLAVPAAAAPARFWFEDEENNATNIKTIESSDMAVKFIENGQLLIKRDGIVYEAMGRVIR